MPLNLKSLNCENWKFDIFFAISNLLITVITPNILHIDKRTVLQLRYTVEFYKSFVKAFINLNGALVVKIILKSRRNHLQKCFQGPARHSPTKFVFFDTVFYHQLFFFFFLFLLPRSFFNPNINLLLT